MKEAPMADQSPLEKVEIESTPRTPSRPHSPKWPHPGGGGWGERAWTKEPVYCRSHGPPPFVDPRAIRDVFPKRKEWEAQFPQPVVDLHCEFHGNKTQDYFQRELRRISRTRLSLTKDVPAPTLEDFLQEKQKKIERAISNQRERDRKSLRIIHKLEKENLEKHDSQSNKELGQKRVAEGHRRPLKGAEEAVLPKQLKKGLQDKQIADRHKNPILYVDAQTLSKIGEEEVRKVYNSMSKDVHVGFKDGYVTSKGEKRGLKTDPWSREIQNTGGKFVYSKTHKQMHKPAADKMRFDDTSPLSKLEEHAVTSQVPNDGREISEEFEGRVDTFPGSPLSIVGAVKPGINQPYQWISIPQTLSPAPVHIEDPYHYSASYGPPQKGRNPTSAVTVPVTLLSSPILLGYHDTYKMPTLPILVGH